MLACHVACILWDRHILKIFRCYRFTVLYQCNYMQCTVLEYAVGPKLFHFRLFETTENDVNLRVRARSFGRLARHSKRTLHQPQNTSSFQLVPRSTYRRLVCDLCLTNLPGGPVIPWPLPFLALSITHSGQDDGAMALRGDAADSGAPDRARFHDARIEVTCSVLIICGVGAAHHPRRCCSFHSSGAGGSGAASVQGPQPRGRRLQAQVHQ